MNHEIENKRLMIVAGGDWQVDLVKKAKSMGCWVLCSNLYKNSPAFQYSDACEVADIKDIRRNLEIAREYKPDAVLSDQSDLAVPTVACLNEMLGLRGIGTDKAALLTDKYMQRKYCMNKGFSIPDFKLCESEDAAYDFLEKYKRIIIKPIDSQSSRGVHKVTTREELHKYYLDAMSWSNKMDAFLAEEYMDGDEFTIDGVVVKGKHYPLCISIKEMHSRNSNISLAQYYSHYSEKYDYDRLRSVNSDFYNSIGLPFGLTHSEYKFYKGDFYLVEASARGGGSNLSSRIVPFMSSVDNYEILIKESLGIEIDERIVKDIVFPRDKRCIMRFFDFGKGIVDEVIGLERLRSSRFLLDYQVNVHVGDNIGIPAFGRERHGHFIIASENEQELEKEADEILDAVCVRFSADENSRYNNS